MPAFFYFLETHTSTSAWRVTLGSPGLLPVPSDGGPGRAIYSPVAGAIIFKPHHSVANEKDEKFTAPVTDRVTASPLIEV